MPDLKIVDLNRLYSEAEEADREVFAEMRSNILLVAGQHYEKRGSQTFDRRTTASETHDQKKLRLVKNHIHKVSRHYVTSILSYAPGVTILPNNEKEVQDQKAADLNKSVLQYIETDSRMSEKDREFCKDFVDIGEVCVKVFWDYNRGELKGFEQGTDELGNPLHNEDGSPMQDATKPVFTGAFVFERIFGFNLLRHPGISSMQTDNLPWIIRKMVPIEDLKTKYKGDDEKLRFIQPAKQDEFVVFDSAKASYSKEKTHCLIREYFWPVSPEYPMGYFAVATEYGILEEGQLPEGIWPIAWAGFDESQSSPRGRSIIKVARPYNAEINRASSQAAMAQVTVGDDKVLYQKGTKLEQGALLPGVRGISFSGMPPQILPGRDGGQFMPYISAQIVEMNEAVGLEELMQEKPSQLDPYAMLHRSIRDKQKFSIYSQKFEQFLVDKATITLKLAKEFLPDDCLIPAIGRSEIVNIQEFRNTDPLCYQIKLEPGDETAEALVGKQLALTQILQYVGSNLKPEQIAVVARAMPFGNAEEAFAEFLIDNDNAKNDILALDRGEVPQPDPNENHEYIIKRLTNRMKQADFKYLDPQIQQNYYMVRQQHDQLMAEQAQKIKMMESQLIPTGGALITCDMYVPDPADPAKSKRLRIPYDALNDLVQKLEAQGHALDTLHNMNPGAASDAASLFLQSMGQGPQGQESEMAAPPNSAGLAQGA